MPAIHDKALLLRSIPYGDSSLICHFLGQNHGRLPLMARGARRAKSVFRANLAILHDLEISWRPGRTGMGILLQIERGPALIRDSLLVDGQQLLAVAAALFPEGDVHGYEETHAAMNFLSFGGESAGLLLASWWLLERAGLIGGLDRCWSCGAEVAESETMAWSQAQLVCHACGGAAAVHPGLRRSIQALLQRTRIALSQADVRQWRMMIRLVLQAHGVRLPDYFRS